MANLIEAIRESTLDTALIVVIIATAAPFFGLEFCGRRTKGRVFPEHAASPA